MSIKDTAVRVGYKSLLLGKKYSPEILTGVGIIGGVTAAILGARATLRLEPLVTKFEEQKLQLTELKHAKNDDKSPMFTDKEIQKASVEVYVRNTVSIGKLYAPAVSLGAVSIASIILAHGIMHRRQVALVAAVKVLETGWGEYRKRVVAEIGEDKERDIWAGVQEEITTDENGKKAKELRTLGQGMPSPYARFFDESSTNWEKNAEYNLMFLRSVESWMNDKLKLQGFLFLNDVYDALGIERSSIGQLVGWVIGKGTDKGDHYVDFGMYDYSDAKRAFINGNERSILLDFNVDGQIYDLI